MLEFDEENSKGCVVTSTQPMNKFLSCKSNLRYKDEHVNERIYELLEDKIGKHYADRKDFNLIIGHPHDNKKIMSIWFTLNFKEDDDCAELTGSFMDEFELLYKKFKKEAEEETMECHVVATPRNMGPHFRKR
jgi:hypothetical protein